jgi:hypothetical protein
MTDPNDPTLRARRAVPIAAVLATFALAGCPPPVPGPAGGVPVYVESWSGVTAGAATGYCLAKHPYLGGAAGSFTDDGYEIAAVPGVVGAIRRNYVYKRTPGVADEGAAQTCEMACRQFGTGYEPQYQGRALRLRRGETTIADGIGDMASMAVTDQDFYLNRENVAGIRSMSTNWHEADVAQADFCCCHVAEAGH